MGIVVFFADSRIYITLNKTKRTTKKGQQNQKDNKKRTTKPKGQQKKDNKKKAKPKGKKNKQLII